MSKNEEMVDGSVTGYGSFLPILLWGNSCTLRVSLQHTSGPRTVTTYVCDKYPYLDTLYNCLSEAPGIDLENSVDESL